MLILYLVLAASIALFGARQECSDWRSCRDSAAAAATAQDYEAFHDLAWRAVQKGPKNDPELMLLLARAQALSGRPGDALVMLARLADRGVAVDAATNPDFRRVRALPGWPDLERRLAAIGTGSPGKADAPTAPAATTAAGEPPVETKEAKAAPVEVTPPAAPAPTAPAAGTPSALEPEEALRFPTSGLIPEGLAYDGVSRRFLIADRHARKLAVVDEFSRHVATLSGAQASFGDIEALEIDARAGDLWVVSSEPAAAGGATTLHKLQLVSGRVLSTYTLPPQLAPAHFVDVAIANGGTVFVLDGVGRVLRLNGGGLELVAPIPAGARSLAPTGNGSIYVATADGVLRVETASRTLSPVVAPAGASINGLQHLRWHRGVLIGVQRLATATRVVRLRLDRSGRAVTALEVIDTIDAPADAVTISGNTLYYFASKVGGEVVLKKVTL